MTYPEALEHLQALGPELPPTKPAADATAPPRHKFDLIHMRRLCAALGNPQDTFPSILIAGTNGKGSTSATLASILVAAGYRTALYTSPHLSRINERIQLAHPILPSEYGTSIAGGAAPGADGPLALGQIPDATFADLYTRVDEAAKTLVSSGDLPYPPSFFERITAIAFLFFAEQHTEIAILEVGLGGRLDATNIVEPLISVITDIALDHQDYLGDTITLIAAEKCGILRQNGTLITLPQLPEANQAIGIAATTLNVRAINAANYIPPPQRASDVTPGHPSDLSFRSEGGVPGGRSLPVGVQAEEPASPVPAATVPESFESDSEDPTPLLSALTPHIGLSFRSEAEEPAFPFHTPAIQLPRNQYTLSLEDGTPLKVDSPLPGHHQQRNIALAIATALTLNNGVILTRSEAQGENPSSSPEAAPSIHFQIPISAIETGIRTTHWPARLEFLPPNLLIDVAHNPAGAWTLRSAIASLPEHQPRTLIFSCLRDKSLEEMSRILFPLFDSSPDSDPLRRHDHIILAPIANPRAAAVEDLLAAAHALSIPAHAAPHLAAALAQAKQITPDGGLIIATGSVYLVGEIRDLAITGAP